MRIGLDSKTKERIQPQKGVIAICQCCGLDLLPKCGKIKVHHWAHSKGCKCDRWWESETEWHRNWKNEFPIEWQEVIKYDHENKEKHIADIFNHYKELVIEFQNSPINVDELKSRERFYGKMIWVVNSINSNIETFPLQLAQKNIEEIELKYSVGRTNSFFAVPYEIKEKLIRIRDKMLEEMLLGELQIRSLKDLFNREIDLLINQYEIGTPKPIGVNSNQFLKELLHPIFYRTKKEINELIQLNGDRSEESKYYGYKWPEIRKIWSHASKPVFLDRGMNLFLLKSEWILKKISRKEFVEYYGPSTFPKTTSCG